MTLDVALASCMSLPDPDDDEAPLLAALRDAELSAETLAWDDPHADFARARATLLRATWNYPDRPRDFLAWIDRTAVASALWNPAHVVKWNVHKRYLLELESRGVAVVPTRLVRRGERASLADVMRERGWIDVVVKPAVSAGSRSTMRTQDASRGQAHFAKVLAGEDVLVQPYVASVEHHGERAIVWIDGEITHAVRKSPRFTGDAERTSDALPVADDEADLALRAVACAPGPLLYARIDVARDESGAPRVMELELIEPSLFFPRSRAALDRYVAAVVRLVRRSPRL